MLNAPVITRIEIELMHILRNLNYADANMFARQFSGVAAGDFEHIYRREAIRETSPDNDTVSLRFEVHNLRYRDSTLIEEETYHRSVNEVIDILLTNTHLRDAILRHAIHQFADMYARVTPEMVSDVKIVDWTPNMQLFTIEFAV